MCPGSCTYAFLVYMFSFDAFNTMTTFCELGVFVYVFVCLFIYLLMCFSDRS